jgi:hypothetical protein
MAGLLSDGSSQVKVDRAPNFHETYLSGWESKIRRVNFLLRAVGNGHACDLCEESRQKFINATELDRKSAGNPIGSRLFTNQANVQAPKLFFCNGDMHGCDDDVLDIKGAFVVLSLGRCHL